jgi:hypothetical protein
MREHPQARMIVGGSHLLPQPGMSSLLDMREVCDYRM